MFAFNKGFVYQPDKALACYSGKVQSKPKVSPILYIIHSLVYNVNMNFNNIIIELQNTNYVQVLLALVVGVILGFIFIKLELPIPAPPVLAGVVGIVGIWLGYLIGR